MATTAMLYRQQIADLAGGPCAQFLPFGMTYLSGRNWNRALLTPLAYVDV